MAVWQTSIACMSNGEIKIAVGRTLGTIAPPEENYQNPTLRYTTVNRRVSVISNHSTTAHTLQICDIITYNGDVDESSAYRVKSFLKQWVPPALTDEEQSIMDLLNIDNNNREDEALPARIALVRCHPKEAQFVSAIGTCGIIAPITHVTRVGCVDWDDNTINEERERYAKLDTGKAKNFLAYIDDRWGFLNK